MRVAIVALSCTGDMRESTLHLTRSLLDQAEVHLFVPTGTEVDREVACAGFWHETLPISFAGHAWRRVLTQANPLVHAANAKRVRRVLPDIVHFAVPHHANALMIPLLNAPACLTLHGCQELSGAAGLIRGDLQRRALAQAEHLVVEERSLREDLLQSGMSPERVSLIPQEQEDFASRHLTLYRRITERLHASGWALYGG